MRVFSLFLAMLLFSCATNTTLPESVPSGSPGLAMGDGGPAIEEPDDVLDLPTCLALVLQRNPQLAAAGDLERLRRARRRSALAGPDPGVSLAWEDYPGTGPYRSFTGSRWTLQVSQLLELGGKPGARAALADAQSDGDTLEFAISRLALLSRVTHEFSRVAHLQARLENLRGAIGASEAQEAAVLARVAAGRDSPVQARRYVAGLMSLRQEHADLVRRLEAARRQLASNWGNALPRFRQVAARFTPPESLPASDQLEAGLQRHPELVRRQAAIAALRAARRLESAQAIPDVEVSLGLRATGGEGDVSVVGGVSLSLPVWGRGRRVREEFDARLAVAGRDLEVSRHEMKRRLEAQVEEYGRAREELLWLAGSFLPRLEEDHRLLLEGFSLGRFTILELLEVRRSLVEGAARLIDARLNLQTAVVELEFLTGRRLQAPRSLSGKTSVAPRAMKSRPYRCFSVEDSRYSPSKRLISGIFSPRGCSVGFPRQAPRLDNRP